MVSEATTQLCSCSLKAVTDNINEQSWLFSKKTLQKWAGMPSRQVIACQSLL